MDFTTIYNNISNSRFFQRKPVNRIFRKVSKDEFLRLWKKSLEPFSRFWKVLTPSGFLQQFTTIYNNLQQFTTIFDARVGKNQAGSKIFVKNIINITICRPLPIFITQWRLEPVLCFRKWRPGEIRLRSWLQEAPGSRVRLNQTIFRAAWGEKASLFELSRTDV